MPSFRTSAIVLALLLAAPARAFAEPAQDTAEATARDLGDEALRRFQAGSWQAAYEMFQKADALFHAPTLVLYMGHCQARLGNLAGAHRHYRAVMRERLGPDAPVQFRTAQDIAAQELRWVDQRLGVITIAVVGPSADRARILVDATEVGRDELEGVGLAPGEHVIEVWALGAASIRQTLTVAAGQRTKVALDLSLEPAPKEPTLEQGHDASTPPAPQHAPEPTPARPSWSPAKLFLPAAVLAGAGGAALLAGTVTGALSLHAADDVKSRCSPTGHCAASDAGEAAYAGQLADASTGALIAGGVVLAAGVVLEVLHVQGRIAPARPQVGLGLGNGTLRGTF